MSDLNILVNEAILKPFAIFVLVAYYIQQCHKSDPDVDVCLKQSANRFARYVQKGIPELEIAEVRVDP